MGRGLSSGLSLTCDAGGVGGDGDLDGVLMNLAVPRASPKPRPEAPDPVLEPSP